MAKTNRASLLWLALFCPGVNNVALPFDGDVAQRLRDWAGGPRGPQGVSKYVPLGAEMVRGAIDRFQEH